MMNKKKLRLSRALKFRIHGDGKIYGSLSNTSGEFYISPEVLAILIYFSTSTDQKNLGHFLKEHYQLLLNHLPNQTQCDEIINDLIQSGFLMEEKQSASHNTQPIGFADPWIQWAMVSDEKRSVSYEKALKKCITKNSIVLDLGSGTGFLSACALELGAKKVYAIEESGISDSIEPNLKNLNLIHKNEKIRNFISYAKNSHDVKIPKEVNLVVSELFGNDPFQEGLYSTLRDITNRIKLKNIMFIPDKLQIFGELINILNHPAKNRIQLYQNTITDTKDNFYKKFLISIKKVLPFEGISFPIQLMRENFEQISTTLNLGSCTLNPLPQNTYFAKAFSGEKEIKIEHSSDSPIFIFWFRVHLTDDISISSHPNEFDYACHWSPIAVVLNKNISLGTKLRIKYNLSSAFDALECRIFENNHLIGMRL